MTEEEMAKEEMAKEYAEENKTIYGSDEYADITDYLSIKEAFLAGYEQGIGRLRFCCTCKKYMSECWDKTEPYGICADWEIIADD